MGRPGTQTALHLGVLNSNGIGYPWNKPSLANTLAPRFSRALPWQIFGVPMNHVPDRTLVPAWWHQTHAHFLLDYL